jgi:hypothetical protein
MVDWKDTKRLYDKPATGPGGKFDSIGSAQSQADNLALVTKLLPRVKEGRRYLNPAEWAFIEDCMVKMNQHGSRAMFGWRQVEKVVELARRVEMEGGGGREDKA